MDARGGDGRRRSTRPQVEGIVRDLVDSGVESLTVWPRSTPMSTGRTSRRSARSSSELYPGFPVTISSEVLPEFREYERTLTACMNSYVRPQVQHLRRPPRRPSLHGASASEAERQHPALRRGADDDPRRRREPDLRRPLRPVRRCRRSALRRAHAPATTTSSRSTWAVRRPTSRSARTASRRSAARPRSASSGSRCRPSTCTPSAPAAARSRTCRELTGALRVGPQSAGAEPGPAAYGKGGDGADGDRRERRARPSPAAPARRRDGARRRGGAKPRSQTIARRDGPDRRAGRRGDPRDRQREHGRRAAARVACSAATTRATSRSSPSAAPGPLHANAVARLMGSFPVIVPPAPGLLCAHRRPRRRLPRRVRADVHPPDRRGERRRGRGRSSTSSAAGPETGSRREGDRSPTAQHVDLLRRHALPPARATRSRSRSSPRGARRRLADLEERFNGLHEQLYGFRMPGHGLRDRQPARGRLRLVPKPELPAGEPAQRGRIGRRHRRARGRASRASGWRRGSTTAPGSQPGAPYRRPGDRDRVRLDDGRARRATSPRSTATSTS